jgi:hypothetical protein
MIPDAYIVKCRFIYYIFRIERSNKLWGVFLIEGPRSRCYGRTAALRLIVQPCDENDEVFFCFSILMEHRWNEIDRGYRSTRRKTCTSTTVSTTNPT